MHRTTSDTLEVTITVCPEPLDSPASMLTPDVVNSSGSLSTPPAVAQYTWYVVAEVSFANVKLRSLLAVPGCAAGAPAPSSTALAAGAASLFTAAAHRTRSLSRGAIRTAKDVAVGALAWIGRVQNPLVEKDRRLEITPPAVAQYTSYSVLGCSPVKLAMCGSPAFAADPAGAAPSLTAPATSHAALKSAGTDPAADTMHRVCSSMRVITDTANLSPVAVPWAAGWRRNPDVAKSNFLVSTPPAVAQYKSYSVLAASPENVISKGAPATISVAAEAPCAAAPVPAMTAAASGASDPSAKAAHRTCSPMRGVTDTT
mmetsp:Transcript_31304/g.68595  ORF Transcript_31304/g.68595 Transcript_31304/m.68595 type:complete len:315 (+) Transcript_31304:307-1251(+)